MSFIEMLNLLEVNNDYTESELKKKYRKKAMKCHPDLFQNAKDKEEEFKKLNNAYEYLLKRLDNSKNKESFNLNIYKAQMINKIEYFLNCDVSKYEVVRIVKDELSELLSLFKENIKNASSKSEVDENFDKFFSKYVEVLNLLKSKVYKENMVDENEVEEDLNYKSNLVDFYMELLKISNKYGIKEKTLNKINQSLNKYENNIFENFDEFVNECKKETFDKIVKNNFVNASKYIDEMVNKVESAYREAFRVRVLAETVKANYFNSVYESNLIEKFEILISLEKITEEEYNDFLSVTGITDEEVELYYKLEDIREIYDTDNERNLESIREKLIELKRRKVFEIMSQISSNYMGCIKCEEMQGKEQMDNLYKSCISLSEIASEDSLNLRVKDFKLLENISYFYVLNNELIFKEIIPFIRRIDENYNYVKKRILERRDNSALLSLEEVYQSVINLYNPLFWGELTLEDYDLFNSINFNNLDGVQDIVLEVEKKYKNTSFYEKVKRKKL